MSAVPDLNDPIVYVRAVHFAAAIDVAGVVFFAVFVAAPAFRAPGAANAAARLRTRLAWMAWIGLALAVLSGAAWFVLTAASMSGDPLPQALSAGVLSTVLLQTDFGGDWIARSVMVGALAILFVPLFAADLSKPPDARSRLIGYAAVLCAAAFCGALAFAGHAIGGEGVEGVVHPAADVLHLLAAAAWVGGLAPLAVLLTLMKADAASLAAARTATQRFSNLGIVAVAALVLSGLVNSWYLVGDVSALTTSEYGRLLTIKLLLFLVMVGIAAVNWSRLTPQLTPDAGSAAGQRARRGLRRNAVIEVALGTAIVVIVGVLGTLPPASHAHHHAPDERIPADATFQHIHGDEGMADVTIEPGHVGQAQATIRLWNDDLETLEARQVTLTLTAPQPGGKPITRTAVADLSGAWIVGGIDLGRAGNWTVTVTAVLGSGKRLLLTAPIVVDPK